MQLTCLDYTAASADVQIRGDEGYIGQIEDLGAMGQGHCPQLGGRAEHMDEAFARARTKLGTVGEIEKVGVPIVAVLAIEVFTWGDEEGLDSISCLLECE